MSDHSNSGPGAGRDDASRADLVPFDFSAIRPSADHSRFDRTVSSLAGDMLAARLAAGLGSPGGRAAATMIAWRRPVALAAAAVTLLAVSSLLRGPRTERVDVPLPVAQAAGIPPRLAEWAQDNYRPTPTDLIAAFSGHLNSPLSR